MFVIGEISCKYTAILWIAVREMSPHAQAIRDEAVELLRTEHAYRAAGIKSQAAMRAFLASCSCFSL